jgi:hypothetical protein
MGIFVILDCGVFASSRLYRRRPTNAVVARRCEDARSSLDAGAGWPSKSQGAASPLRADNDDGLGSRAETTCIGWKDRILAAPHENASAKTTLIGADAAAGDIFYFHLMGRYYFLQVIDVRQVVGRGGLQERLYLMVVFEKSFATLPVEVSELNLRDIYRVKSKPRNCLLYIVTSDPDGGVSISRTSSGGYEDYKDIKVHRFGSATPAARFEPDIVIPHSFFPVNAIEDDAGIDVTPNWAEFTYVFDRIENDRRLRTEKLGAFTPVYFGTWRDEVDTGALLKMEKIFAALDLEADAKAFLKKLKGVVSEINKLERKTPFIYTIEAEDIMTVFDAMMARRQIPADEGMTVIERHREW